MPTTIREGVEDTARCLVSEKEIERLYPDAYRWMLPNFGHVWASRSCLRDCTNLELVSREDEVHFALYLRVKDMSVFYPSLISGNVVTIIVLKEKNPKLYAELVETIKDHLP